MTAGQTISSDSRIVELLELLTNSQMNTHTEQVKQMCEYVETMEQQLSFMTEEIKNVRQKLESMKEETLSKRVKYGLQKTADTLHKQCDFLKQQVSCGLLVTGGICHHDQKERMSNDLSIPFSAALVKVACFFICLFLFWYFRREKHDRLICKIRFQSLNKTADVW